MNRILFFTFALVLCQGHLVRLPEGNYTIQCADHGTRSAGLFISFRDTLALHLVEGGLLAAVAGIALNFPLLEVGVALGAGFYYLFTRGLMDLSPKEGLKFHLEHLNTKTPHFRLRSYEWKGITYVGKGNKLQHDDNEASSFIAQRVQSYPRDPYLVYLSVGKKWLRAGRSRFLSSHHTMYLSKSQRSRWRFIPAGQK